MSIKYDALVEVETRLKTLTTFKKAVQIGLMNRISGKACIFLTAMDSENTDDEYCEYNVLVKVYHTGSDTKKCIENILTDENDIIDVIEDGGSLSDKVAWVQWEKTNYTIDVNTMFLNGMDMEFKIKIRK